MTNNSWKDNSLVRSVWKNASDESFFVVEYIETLMKKIYG